MAYAMPSVYGSYGGYGGFGATMTAPIMGTIQAPIAATATMPMGVSTGIIGASAAPVMSMGAGIGGGMVHPDYPSLGPAQPYPTSVTAYDEMLLQKLHFLGHTAGTDGLPGYPYIGAPYIGVWSEANNYGAEAPAEEEEYPAQEEEEVRGTQV